MARILSSRLQRLTTNTSHSGGKSAQVSRLILLTSYPHPGPKGCYLESRRILREKCYAIWRIRDTEDSQKVLRHLGIPRKCSAIWGFPESAALSADWRAFWEFPESAAPFGDSQKALRYLQGIPRKRSTIWGSLKAERHLGIPESVPICNS